MFNTPANQEGFNVKVTSWDQLKKGSPQFQGQRKSLFSTTYIYLFIHRVPLKCRVPTTSRDAVVVFLFRFFFPVRVRIFI